MSEKDLKFIEDKELREQHIDRLEVLDLVGDLIQLPKNEYSTIEQVANYYGVGLEAIRSIVKRHRDELGKDGLRIHKKKEVECYVHGEPSVELLQEQGYLSIIDSTGIETKIANRGALLLPKRAVLRIGMLLIESEVAKEVRTRLLDIVYDTEEDSPEVIENVVGEMSEEKELMLRRMQAEFDGKPEEVMYLNAKLFELKNRRIKELEDTNEMIISNSLTIKESRAVINRIVRSVATRKMNGNFKDAYSGFYTHLNYKLGINIRRRKGGGSLLDKLSEEEIYEAEKVARSWAVDSGLDLEELLGVR